MDQGRGKTPRKRTAIQPQDPVEVYCRVRPLENPDAELCVKVLNEKSVLLIPPENSVVRNGQVKEMQYLFEHVFDEYTSQKAVFDYVSLPLVEDLLHGKNGLLFTYGITSSGKTYTMTGHPQDQGIMPRCLDVLFNSIKSVQAKKYVFRPDRMNGFELQTEADAMLERQQREIMPSLIPRTPVTPRTKDRGEVMGETARIPDMSTVGDVEDDNCYAVFVSYIEIYNNIVYDLLEELPFDTITGYKPPQSKILRKDGSDNMYVHNCVEVEVKCPDDAFGVFYRGQKRRKVAHTTLNAESSRSHSVFTIRVVQAPLDPRGEEVLQDPSKIIVSQLSLVDLAGSERTKRTNNQGDRLKEAGNINQTLMVLRSCIEMLRDNQKNNTNKMVPYRDSKVTHLFRNFFDGEGKVRMILCINPKAEEFDETMHVMKFGKLTQEVLVTRQQQIEFDIGFTPGRRKLNQKFKEAMEYNAKIEDELAVPAPSLDYTLGPAFPPLELLSSADDETLHTLEMFLEERERRRQMLLIDQTRREDEFRAVLVEFEREYGEMRARLDELEPTADKRDKDLQRVEARNRSLERRNEELSRALREMERTHQTLGLKLQDKNWKIDSERREKERLKADFRTRLDMNNQQWERNLEKEKRKLVVQAGAEIKERDMKLKILGNIANEVKTPRRPAPKPRTYTAPGVITPARSDTDVSSMGYTPRVTRAAAARMPAARSMQGLNHIGTSSASSGSARITTARVPVVNPRYHRRSKSSSNAEVWLDHRPVGNVELGTVLQPKMTKKRSVSKLDVKDTKSVSKYCLTHQEADTDGEIETKLIKGDVVKTSTGGRSIIFNDVETLRQTSPGSRKRRSSCPQPQDYEGEWTDTESRCSIAIEGHHKKTKSSMV